MKPLVKLCGMRHADNIRAAEALGLDMMGFICWERSPRYVATVPAYLPCCPRVGVFVNPSLRFVRERVEALGLSYVQLHGSESAEFQQEVMRDTGCKGIKVRSLPLPHQRRGEPRTAEKDSLSLGEGWGEAFSHADLLLFDTKCETAGGSGRKFSWDLLADYHGPLPFLLSGGIGPEDVGLLRQLRHPHLIGVDINSRFETAPGIKDTDKVKDFIKAIREHEQD